MAKSKKDGDTEPTRQLAWWQLWCPRPPNHGIAYGSDGVASARRDSAAIVSISSDTGEPNVA